MKKKLVAVLLSSAMVMTLFAGCGSSDDAAADNKDDVAADDAADDSADAATGSVYYLNFKPESDQAWQALAESYTEQTGVPVKVVTAASGEYEATLTAEMGKSSAPTLFQCGNQQGLNTWGDYCLDLSDSDVYAEMTT